MSDVLRIGLVGTGGIMGVHAQRFLHRTDARIVALCDPDSPQITAFQSRFPDLDRLPSYTTDTEMLAQEELDAVVIASPHTLHRDQIVRAFEAGCHVLAEKPLATNTPDVKACIDARNKAGKVGALAYQRHGDGAFRWIKSTIESGVYGKVRALDCHLGQQWYQFTKGSWRQNLSLSGGGQINDSGSHMIDVLLWATGLQALQVTAFMDNLDSEVDINSVVNIQFDNGALGTLTIVGDAALWHERHYIWLEEAMIANEGGELKVVQRDGTAFTIDRFPNAVAPADNFVEACLNGVELLATFECGAATIALTEAAWKSAYSNNAPAQVIPF